MKLARVVSRVLVPFLLLSAFSACKRRRPVGAPTAETQPANQATMKARVPNDAPIQTPPIPTPVVGNPLVGANLFVDPQSLAMLKMNALSESDPHKARTLEKIAYQPQGLWMGEWNSDVFRAVEHFVHRAKTDGSVPVLIAYNIPVCRPKRLTSAGSEMSQRGSGRTKPL